MNHIIPLREAGNADQKLSVPFPIPQVVCFLFFQRDREKILEQMKSAPIIDILKDDLTVLLPYENNYI